MKNKLKKAFFAAVFGIGAGFAGAGTYMAGDAALKEYITHQQDYDLGKDCVDAAKEGQACSPEGYHWAAMYADKKSSYGLGLSWLFGGVTLVRVSRQRLKGLKSKDGPSP